MFKGVRVHAVESISVFYSCRNGEQDRRDMRGVLKCVCKWRFYSILQETNERAGNVSEIDGSIDAG